MPPKTNQSLIRTLASLRITVTLFVFSLFLVYFGTLAQVELGISIATEKFFRSWFVYWEPESLPYWPFPIFLPAAYAIGAGLMVNLIAAFISRFRYSGPKAGILLIHAGIIIMLTGELLTGIFQVESYITIDEGKSKNYSESRDESEIIVARIEEGDTATVYAFDEDLLTMGNLLKHEEIPFSLRIDEFIPNARVAGQQLDNKWQKSKANIGIGSSLFVQEFAIETEMGRYDAPLVHATLINSEGKEMGTWLLSALLAQPQEFSLAGQTWRIKLRPRRFYQEYHFKLLDFAHDRYAGTGKARNFSSRIILDNPTTNESREVLIKMNEPLRYQGLTYYQHSFDNADTTTILQVVQNPARAFPYISCAVVSLGLIFQFMMSLIRHQDRQKAKAKNAAANSEGSSSTLPQSKKSFPKIAWGIPALLILLLISSAMRAPKSEYNLKAFGKLPVLLNGRVQPLDSVARNSLTIMSGKSKLELEDESKMSAIEWFLEVVSNQEISRDRDLFLIHNKDIIGQLELDPEKKFFSFHELTLPKKIGDREIDPAKEINDQALEADKVKAALRNTYQRDILDLHNKVSLFKRLVHSLRPNSQEDFAEELKTYEQILIPGREAFLLQQAGQTHDPQALGMLGRFAKRYYHMADFGYFFPVPPVSSESDISEWKRTAEALILTIRGDNVPESVHLYAQVLEAFRSADSTTFNEKTDELKQLLTSRRPEEAKTTSYEQNFNQTAPFTLAQVSYVLALLVVLFGLLLKKPWLVTSSMLCIVIGFIVHTAGIASRMYIDGRPPVTNLYSSAVFIGWGSVLLALIIELFSKRGLALIAATLIGFSTLVIAHNLSLDGDTLEMMQAVLDSNFWLATHVIIITLGYSGTFFAGFLAIVYLIMGLFESANKKQNLKALNGMIYAIICFSMLFSFVGTVLGGIWADQSWGRFWGWDPKENGALLIVIWNALILHSRWGGFIQGTGVAVLAVFGNIVTAWSWFGTNMLSIGLHSYGFMDAANIALKIFILSQLSIMLLGLFPGHKNPVKKRLD